MNDLKTAPVPSADASILQTLAGLNAHADLVVVQRTRRAVLLAGQEMRERRSRTRRNAAIAVLTIAVLGMVLTPALWSSVNDFLGGEEFFELHSMMMALFLLLFSTMLGALVIGLRGDYVRMPHKRR